MEQNLSLVLVNPMYEDEEKPGSFFDTYEHDETEKVLIIELQKVEEYEIETITFDSQMGYEEYNYQSTAWVVSKVYEGKGRRPRRVAVKDSDLHLVESVKVLEFSKPYFTAIEKRLSDQQEREEKEEREREESTRRWKAERLRENQIKYQKYKEKKAKAREEELARQNSGKQD